MASSPNAEATSRVPNASAIAESAFPQLVTGARPVELSVKLAGDEEVRGLNAQWRGRDKATNVLSFPLAETTDFDNTNVAGAELLLGDIILARGVCEAEANDKGVENGKEAVTEAANVKSLENFTAGADVKPK